jgi:hypothetical protein
VAALLAGAYALAGAYVVVMLVWISASARIALYAIDADRRRDAIKVLRLLLTAVAAGGGIVGVVVKLYELGLLR